MTVRFNTNVHASLMIPKGTFKDQGRDIILPVRIDELRQALELIYARMFGVDTDVTSAQAELDSLAAAGLVVVASGNPTAGSGSGVGRTLSSIGLITLTDGGAGANLEIAANVTDLDAISPIASTDEVPIYDLSEAAWRKTTVAGIAGGAAPAAHASSHETGGSDPITSLAASVLTSGTVPLARIQEVMALADLSDVAAKTGTGTTVVMQVSPTITSPSISTRLHMGSDPLTIYNGSTTNIPVVRLSDEVGAANPDYLTIENSNANRPAISGTGVGADVAPRLTVKGSTLQADISGGKAPGEILTTTSPAADLPDHASTHNTGGGDALTALSATILTSGIIPDARMPDFTGDVTTSEGAVATLVATKLRTHSRIIYIESPTAADEFPICYIGDAATLTRIVGVTDVGTVDFNIEKRSKLTPDVAGTNVEGSDVQATAGGLDDTSFTSASISADSWLTYAASAVASSPTKLWVAIEWTID